MIQLLKPHPSNTDAIRQTRAARQQQETRPRDGVSISTKDQKGPDRTERMAPQDNNNNKRHDQGMASR